ncbi:MAG: hypothetical protein ACXABK_02135, partial [Candidatus Heimdallarchaeaceae archaeon]
MKRRKRILFVLLLSSLIIISSFNMYNSVTAREPIANLVLKTNGGGPRPDYGLFIAQYLRDIGIEVELKVEEWSVFVGELALTRDYDLAIVGLYADKPTPDLRAYFTEDGSVNCANIKREYPYCNQSEQMLIEGVRITDLEERQQHYYDWQQLLMDKIVPILPLYTVKSYWAFWSNLKGYDSRWGFRYCLPYMSWDGYHYGQESLDEFNSAADFWITMNRLESLDGSSNSLIGYFSEPFFTWNPEGQLTKLGIVNDWDKIDDYHYKFYMRDDVYWNPSYNVTERDNNSPSLSTISSSELMLGLKNGEYSDGTNQQVTAKDAVFSILAFASKIVNNSPQPADIYNWISDIYVDPDDDFAFHIHIDGNHMTSELEAYVEFWDDLGYITLLPEFFLNSTNPTISSTSGGVNCTGLYSEMLTTSQWKSFSLSAFGCGMYMVDYYIK